MRNLRGLSGLALRVTDSMLGHTASTLDRAFVAAATVRVNRRPARAEKYTHAERLDVLAQIRDAYAPALAAGPDAFFVRPDPIAPMLTHVRTFAGARVVDASWPSAVVPYLAAVRERYLSNVENRTAHARLFLTDGPPRPAVVLIHGYMGGQWAFEERSWSVRWFLRRGIDVAILVLPFHALRANPARFGPPPFPAADPRYSNEGFRQAIFDLRALIGFLRARGASSVGLMGMSLGGYTTSLAATLDRDLAFAVPIVPLASMADFARDLGRLGTGESADLQHRALEASNFIVSPFARPSLLARDRFLIVGARADRITPISHTDRLARHFETEPIRLVGGHLLQFGRRAAFREISAMLARLGIRESRVV